MVLPGSKFPVVWDMAWVQVASCTPARTFRKLLYWSPTHPRRVITTFFCSILDKLGVMRLCSFILIPVVLRKMWFVLWIATGTLDIRAVGAWLCVSGSLVGGEREASTPRLYYHPTSQFKSRHGVGWGTSYQPTWVITVNRFWLCYSTSWEFW